MSYKNLNSDEKLNNLINFLQFTFNIIKEEAINTRNKEVSAKEEAEIQQVNCCAFTYHRIISLIKNQAIDFNIPLSIFSLDKFDPDKELL